MFHLLAGSIIHNPGARPVLRTLVVKHVCFDLSNLTSRLFSRIVRKNLFDECRYAATF